MSNRDYIISGINTIIDETTSYDFPFFANEERKKEIIYEKKFYIEEKLKQLAPELWPSNTTLNIVWNEALEHANKNFKSLPQKLKINGFYLQELMHFYSEKLGQIILSQVEEV